MMVMIFNKKGVDLGWPLCYSISIERQPRVYTHEKVIWIHHCFYYYAASP